MMGRPIAPVLSHAGLPLRLCTCCSETELAWPRPPIMKHHPIRGTCFQQEDHWPPTATTMSVLSYVGLYPDIDFHPRPRLKSRRPIWSNLPNEAPTIQHLWRTRWQVVDVPNKSLINDPTIQLPEWTCPAANGACSTGSEQTRDHAATACMSGVTSPRHSATAVDTKQ